MATKKIDCDKCQGTGFISAFQHIDNGTCYKCKGTGKINEPRKVKPKKGKNELSEEYLAMVDEISNQIKEEWKNDPRYPEFVKKQRREGWFGSLFERSWAQNFAYEFGYDQPYQIAKKMLEEKGILPF